MYQNFCFNLSPDYCFDSMKLIIPSNDICMSKEKQNTFSHGPQSCVSLTRKG